MTEVPIQRDILEATDAIAEQIRAVFVRHGVYAINLIGSPGAGKTALLEKTLPLLGDSREVAVLEGDIATTRDRDRIRAVGVDCIQINTGNACHIDAKLIRDALPRLEVEGRRIVFVENVGNMVCPAEFDVGEHSKIAVCSVPEGDDKPLKYPLLFQVSDCVVLNKVDLAPYTNFKRDFFRECVTQVNARIPIFEVSCTTGDGLEAWADWLKARAAERTQGAA